MGAAYSADSMTARNWISGKLNRRTPRARGDAAAGRPTNNLVLATEAGVYRSFKARRLLGHEQYGLAVARTPGSSGGKDATTV